MEKDLLATRYFIAALLVSSLLFSPFALDLTLSVRFIAFPLLLLPVLYLLYTSGGRIQLRVDLIPIVYTAYTLWCLLSIAWAHTKAEALFEASKTVLSLAAFGFTYFFLNRNKRYFMEGLYKISVVLFFVIFFIGLFQYIHLPAGDKDVIYAVTGLNSHKNLFASFLFLNLFFLITASINLTGAWKPWTIAAILLCLLTLFILKTKAVWLGLLVVVVVAALLFGLRQTRRRPKISPLITGLIFLLAANVFFLCLLRPLIQKGIGYTAGSASEVSGQKLGLEQERLVIWDKTYPMIKSNPMLGVGMGNWQVFFPNATLSGLWRAEDLNYTFQRPHNDFLWILSETGLIGFNLFLIFLFCIIFYAVGVTLNYTERNFLNGPGLVLAFIIGYFTLSFFDFPKERIEHLLWINVMLGICYYQISETASLKTLRELPVSRMAYIAAFVLLGFLTLIGFQRQKGEYYTKQLLNNRGNLVEVVKSARAATSFAYSLDPTSLPISWYLGNAYASQGNQIASLKAFKQAYRLNPYNRNVVNDLASSYSVNNSNDSAKFFYLEAARISPRFDDPKLNLIALYLNEKNYKSAQECINTLYHDSKRRSNYQRMIDAFAKD